MATRSDIASSKTYHIHGADAKIVVFGSLVVERTSRRHDNDARARIDGERTVAVAVGDFEQQARDGSALHLNDKRAARGIFEHVRSIFALQESGHFERKKINKFSFNNWERRQKMKC